MPDEPKWEDIFVSKCGKVWRHPETGEYGTMNAGHRLACDIAAEIVRLRGLVEAAYREGWVDGNGCIALASRAQIESASSDWNESKSRKECRQQ